MVLTEADANLGGGSHNGVELPRNGSFCLELDEEGNDITIAGRGLDLDFGPDHSLEDLDELFNPRYSYSLTDCADKKRQGVSTLLEEKDNKMGSRASRLSSQPDRDVNALPGMNHSGSRRASNAVAESFRVVCTSSSAEGAIPAATTSDR